MVLKVGNLRIDLYAKIMVFTQNFLNIYLHINVITYLLNEYYFDTKIDNS